jgi:hypothetical protein
MLERGHGDGIPAESAARRRAYGTRRAVYNQNFDKW